jgi:hypothetical protein
MGGFRGWEVVKALLLADDQVVPVRARNPRP